jgi:hypothetical protein
MPFYVLILLAVVTMGVITGAVPVCVGSGVIAVFCPIFCNEVHPEKRVHNVMIAIPTATSGNMSHDLIDNRTLAKSIYVIQGSDEKPSP